MTVAAFMKDLSVFYLIYTNVHVSQCFPTESTKASLKFRFIVESSSGIQNHIVTVQPCDQLFTHENLIIFLSWS